MLFYYVNAAARRSWDSRRGQKIVLTWYTVADANATFVYLSAPLLT